MHAVSRAPERDTRRPTRSRGVLRRVSRRATGEGQARHQAPDPRRAGAVLSQLPCAGRAREAVRGAPPRRISAVRTHRFRARGEPQVTRDGRVRDVSRHDEDRAASALPRLPRWLRRCGQGTGDDRVPTVSSAGQWHAAATAPRRAREHRDRNVLAPQARARGGKGAQCATCHAAILATNDNILPRTPATACAISGCHDGAPVFAITASCTRCHTTAPAKYELKPRETRFSHATHKDTGLPCTGCHPISAAGNEVVTAGHAPCVTCHADDFLKRDPMYCGACHNSTEPWRKLIADRAPPNAPSSVPRSITLAPHTPARARRVTRCRPRPRSFVRRADIARAPTVRVMRRRAAPIRSCPRAKAVIRSASLRRALRSASRRRGPCARRSSTRRTSAPRMAASSPAPRVTPISLPARWRRC